ncbi:MAG TPA: hypothetical protein HPP76_07080 [Desulfuromonadales bacterium]|nr:hypothetical protein [Desulfuromonadales bacterium]
MAVVNHAKKEINAKIVYYGPPGSGKSDSLRYIHGRIKSSLRGELKQTRAGSDNLLFFEFSPFEAPLKHGYALRFHLYTLTGAVTNPATWKMVLKGADGVIVQVDAAAQQRAAARDCVVQLREFISLYGVGLRDMAVVLQCNTPDQSAPVSPSGVAEELDLREVPAHRSAAIGGVGVLETFSAISKMVLARTDDAVRLEERLTDARVGNTGMEVGAAENVETQASAGDTLKEASGCETAEIIVTCEAPVADNGTVRLPIDISCGAARRRVTITLSLDC